MLGIKTRIRRWLRGEAPAEGDETIDIVDLALTIDRADLGGTAYRGRAAVEEWNSVLYDGIASALDPTIVADVGANYGFTALVFSRRFPNAKLVLIEPDPRLCGYIEKNMAQNGVSGFELVSALCGDQMKDSVAFGINPRASQDNRVRGLEGWESIRVASVTLAEVLGDCTDERLFIKIDTQGFETQVFAGAERVLEQAGRWVIKTEFAPHWLRSQGNSPENLLETLVELYDVAEAPARARFERAQLSHYFAPPLERREIPAFVEHVERLDRDGRGWVDLLVVPKGFASS